MLRYVSVTNCVRSLSAIVMRATSQHVQHHTVLSLQDTCSVDVIIYSLLNAAMETPWCRALLGVAVALVLSGRIPVLAQDHQYEFEPLETWIIENGGMVCSYNETSII